MKTIDKLMNLPFEDLAYLLDSGLGVVGNFIENAEGWEIGEGPTKNYYKKNQDLKAATLGDMIIAYRLQKKQTEIERSTY